MCNEMAKFPLVSIILPIHNAEKWIDSCILSILAQTHNGSMELCIYDDACTDSSLLRIDNYANQLLNRDIKLIIKTCKDGGVNQLHPRGCGYAKNQAVASSHGEYLCFLDADDIMMPDRIKLQLEVAMMLPNNTLIGCQVTREPSDSTVRYTKWINNLNCQQLHTQIYTSNGPTIIMPTWFCHKLVFELVGGFDENGKGIPEDYLFFLRFMRLNGNLHRVDKPLLIYRHHPNATTFSVLESTIWSIRIKELEKYVLSKWTSFTIWNAGKQGRKLYRDISDASRKKVVSFCDVDEKKINKKFYTYELDKAKIKSKIPIVHFTDAKKPFVICVKLDLTGGGFEKNLMSLNLVEGVDYVLFS